LINGARVVGKRVSRRFWTASLWRMTGRAGTLQSVGSKGEAAGAAAKAVRSRFCAASAMGDVLRGTAGQSFVTNGRPSGRYRFWFVAAASIARETT
jgi:hypothetical protein